MERRNGGGNWLTDMNGQKKEKGQACRKEAQRGAGGGEAHAFSAILKRLTAAMAEEGEKEE